MKRTFNYTERKRIKREQVEIAITPEEGAFGFDATVDLEAMKLPDDAAIRFEIFDRLSIEVIPAGTVGSPSWPRGVRVATDRFVGSIKARVKIVDDSGEHGKILALADKLPIIGAGSDTESLLATQPDDLDGEVWRIDFDDFDDGPLLKYERSLEVDGIGERIRGPEFFALVYPSALRIVLDRMHREGWLADEEEPDRDPTWRDNWRRFAKALVGEPLVVGADDDAAQQYIDDAVRQFSRRIDALPQYQQLLAGSDS